MKFTKEEISLCKQVAEKERKPLEYGSWYLIIPKDKKAVEEICLYDSKIDESFLVFSRDTTTTVPLWSISDCLEFLRERGYRVRIDEEITPLSLSSNVKCYGHKSNIAVCKFGTTPLEACLKAVLAVLEES